MGAMLVKRLRAGADTIADAMMEATTTEIASYGRLSGEVSAELRREIGLIVESGLTLMFERQPRHDKDLALFATQGERRALAGFPLCDVLRAHSVCSVAAIRQLWRIADESDWAELLPLTNWLSTETPRAADAATFGYVTARAQVGEYGPVRRLVAGHLLDGRSADHLSEAGGLRLAQGYLILAFRLRSPYRMTTAKATAVQARVDAVPGALMRMALSDVVVLVPAEEGERQARAVARQLHTEIAALFEDQTTPAAVAYRPGVSAIPAAAAEARALLRLLDAIPDAKSRSYNADDLLLEAAIVSQGKFADALTRVLAPIRGHDVLHRTVATLLACDLDRERTAAAMGVHRHTIAHRLNRVRELTGIDPYTAHGVVLLRAGVIATYFSEKSAVSSFSEASS
jgi:hypothetical protein